MTTQSKDLFDDTTMSFGDHLEALRIHLWKAVVGLVLSVSVCLLFGQQIIGLMREPIDSALARYSLPQNEELAEAQSVDFLTKLKEGWGNFWSPAGVEDVETRLQQIEVQVSAAELTAALQKIDPKYPIVKAPEKPPADEGQKSPTDGASTGGAPTDGAPADGVTLHLHSPVFAQLQQKQAVGLNIQEPFMTYLKVCMIAGFVVASPWIFWQMWQFVAAGLYRHERKYVKWYGALSLALFLLGFVFCFRIVLPLVIDWLLQFFNYMNVEPQIRLSDWISFAVMMPLMFGISFQLPLVMRFLQAISVVTTQTFRERRRIAIMIIAFLSMVLTPAEPMSMLLMMFPLIVLYEFGILICDFAPTKNPFESEPV